MLLYNLLKLDMEGYFYLTLVNTYADLFLQLMDFTQMYMPLNIIKNLKL